MKDIPPEMQNGKLPPCPLSSQYERLLDDLDKRSTDEILLADTAQDKQLLQQLQAHLPTCPTCTAVVAHARARRSWQRQQLQRLLLEGEPMVPSSTARIMQAIAREKQQVPEEKAKSNGHKTLSGEEENILPLVLPKREVKRQRSAKRSGKLLQNMLAFVAVLALIVASFSLFSHLLVLHSSSSTSSETNVTASKTPKITSVVHATTWSSVIVAQSDGKQQIISGTDPVSGKSAILASSNYPSGTTLDGVSHDGYQVLYHVFDGSKTDYYLQPSTQSTILYTVNGKGGSAIWSTDDSSVFISTPAGIEQVDVKSQQATQVISTAQAPDLLFYRTGYLYFVTGTNANAKTGLNRVALATGTVTTVTGGICSSLSYDFWPSPGGSTVYYRCQGQTALYAITNDGTGAHTVRANAGRIIGYTAQDEPLTLVQNGAAFQVVKLGVDATQDKTVVSDIAPGASDLTVENIAVIPYGFSLVALAHYADGSEKLWYDNIVGGNGGTGTQKVIATFANTQLVSSLQVGGWSRLQVSTQ